jgi:hypothetical protein
MTGIEPAYSAWEADVLPLNYIGAPGKPGLRRLASRAAPADGFRITAASPGRRCWKVIRAPESSAAINVESFLSRPE